MRHVVTIPIAERYALTVPEAAQYVGVSTAHLYRMIADNRIPTTRLDGRVLIVRETLEKLLHDGQQLRQP